MNRRGFLASLLVLPAAAKAIVIDPRPAQVAWWQTPFGTVGVAPSMDEWERFLTEMWEAGQQPVTYYVGPNLYDALRRQARYE